MERGNVSWFISSLPTRKQARSHADAVTCSRASVVAARLPARLPAENPVRNSLHAAFSFRKSGGASCGEILWSGMYNECCGANGWRNLGKPLSGRATTLPEVRAANFGGIRPASLSAFFVRALWC